MITSYTKSTNIFQNNRSFFDILFQVAIMDIVTMEATGTVMAAKDTATEDLTNKFSKASICTF